MNREDLNSIKTSIKREIYRDINSVINKKLAEGVKSVEHLKTSDKTIIFRKDSVKELGRDVAIRQIETKLGIIIADLLGKHPNNDFAIEIYRIGKE